MNPGNNKKTCSERLFICLGSLMEVLHQLYSQQKLSSYTNDFHYSCNTCSASTACIASLVICYATTDATKVSARERTLNGKCLLTPCFGLRHWKNSFQCQFQKEGTNTPHVWWISPSVTSFLFSENHRILFWAFRASLQHIRVGLVDFL